MASVTRSASAVQLDLYGNGPEAHTSTSRRIYPDTFETAWQAYPKRTHDSKQAAYKAWRARLAEGCCPLVMLAGVRRYADYIRKTGRWGTEYVKLASTFFGPNHWFENDYESVLPTRDPTQQLLAFYATENMLY